MLSPIGPGAPGIMRPVSASWNVLSTPRRASGAPTPLFAVAQAGLPPAGEHPQTLALVSDLNILAHSDGVHWIRQDTGAVIV